MSQSPVRGPPPFRGPNSPGRGNRGGRSRGRGPWRGRGRGGPARGRGGPPTPTPPQQTHSDVDFEGDFSTFNVFASQFQKPARPKQLRARGNVSIVPRDENFTPRKSSRGLGYTKAPPRTDFAFRAWEATRPLLKPIAFVSSISHKTLFQEIDELIQVPQSVSANPNESSLPTANQVNHIFGIDEPGDEPGTDTVADKPEEEKTTDFVQLEVQEKLHITTTASEPAPEPVPGAVPEDDVIVYNAPEPSNTSVLTPLPDASSPDAIEALSINFERQATIEVKGEALSSPPKIKGKNKQSNKRVPLPFGGYGALLEEQRLLNNSDSDPRTNSRRRGDSDLDWGDGEDELETDLGDDMLDPDVDQGAMSSFLKTMLAAQGSNAVTIDDLKDIRKLEEEDEELADMRSSAEEKDSSDEDDDDESPDESFQTRLQQIRSHMPPKVAQSDQDAFGYGDGDLDEFDEEDDEEEEEDDGDIATFIQKILDESEDVLSGKDRSGRNKVFKDALSPENALEFNQTKKDRVVPGNLQAQWEQDRQRKAARRKEREVQRILDGGKLKSKSKKKGKVNKYDLMMTGLANPDSSIPTAQVDLKIIEEMMYEFIEDLDGPQSLVLPPMSRECRAQVHQLATAFNLKSKSQGKGEGRFTTLFRTSKTGIGVKTWKIDRLVYGVKRKGALRHNEGEEVGKSAPKLGGENLGFKMLQTLGWEEGEKIGTSGGIDAPLVAKFKRTKLGLGAM